MNIKTTNDLAEISKQTYEVSDLPLLIDLETKTVLKKTRDVRAALAELKGAAKSMPNQDILINTLSLQEAKDSSEIENIITTNDELYQSDPNTKQFISVSAKEVHLYSNALRHGYLYVTETELLTNQIIKNTQAKLEGSAAGFRSQGGTCLKNDQTGEIFTSHLKVFINALFNECSWVVVAFNVFLERVKKSRFFNTFFHLVTSALKLSQGRLTTNL